MLPIDMILILLVIRSLISNLFTFAILLRSTKARIQDVELSEDRRLYIILPVIHETRYITETIEHLHECINGKRNIQVYIVGNSRERNDNNINETLEKARRATEGKSEFSIIELPTKDGVMAHQVNFAANEISRSVKRIDKTWIFIINIDSRFPPKGIWSLIFEVNRNTQIIQQSALFLSNFSKIGLVQKGVAIFQSRWTISHEVKRLVLHSACPYYLCHIVGNGLCINLMKYQEYGNFPTDTLTEDLHFGYYLAASGEMITSLDFFQLADSPVRLLDVFKQKYVWSFGPMLYPIYMMRFKHKFRHKWKRNQLRTLVIMLQGLISYIGWLTSSWLILIFLFEAKHSALAIVFLLLYFAEYFQCIVLFFLRGDIKFSDALIAPLWVFIAVLLHSFPANKALLDVILRRTVIKYKTPHE